MKQDPTQFTQLMIAVIQVQDEPKVSAAIRQFGLEVFEFSSLGGYLGRKNVTILIALKDEFVDSVLDLINTHCKQRVEYISTPLESTPLPLPMTTPIPVGGATVFLIPIDSYREI